MNQPDKKALKILIDTYWSAQRWKTSPKTDPKDFDYAKAAGLMFEPDLRSHNEITASAIRIASEISPESVADAFIASLGSRRLELRSALGSFSVLRHLPRHDASMTERRCVVCGEYLPLAKMDINVLNFERFKWGGVRHDQPRYALFDLELFLTASSQQPGEEDIRILRGLFAAIESAPADTTADTLQNYLAPVVRSNKSERQALVAILGLTGILSTAQHPGYLKSFVQYGDRELPNRRYVDMAYPACWWRRTDGINAEALNFWFGHHLNQWKA